jgi:GGDEF domain-containing protein
VLAGKRVDVAASVGVAYIERGDSPSADLALSRADDRMYEDKRDRYVAEHVEGVDPRQGPAETPA